MFQGSAFGGLLKEVRIYIHTIRTQSSLAFQILTAFVIYRALSTIQASKRL